MNDAREVIRVFGASQQFKRHQVTPEWLDAFYAAPVWQQVLFVTLLVRYNYAEIKVVNDKWFRTWALENKNFFLEK